MLLSGRGLKHADGMEMLLNDTKVFNLTVVNETLWNIWNRTTPYNMTGNTTYLPRAPKIPHHNKTHNMTSYNETSYNKTWPNAPWTKPRILAETNKTSVVKSWIKAKESIFAFFHPHLAKDLGIKPTDQKP